MTLPIIDVEPFVSGTPAARQEIAGRIGNACRNFGFFYIACHGVSEQLQTRLEQLSRRFFAQDLDRKMQIRMALGGRAWRGYFPVGGELTSGIPDLKEGIYFGQELDETDSLVRLGVPLHGPNLFPDNIPEFRQVVLDYMAAMTQLGHVLAAAISLSLNLHETYFDRHYTREPLTLFRVFNYPATVDPLGNPGVGEHTDYGLLTILKQDMAGGLQVKTKSGWLDAAPIPNAFVCNIGDMLDRITGGRYLSAPHRVRNVSGHDRLSFPFFFDPNFGAEVKPLPFAEPLRDNKMDRWDNASVHEFSGTYGEYLLNKVSKVFPELRRTVL